MPNEETTYREGIKLQLKAIEIKIDSVDRKISYTNGKVRKLIISLVLIAGFVLGQALTSKELLTLILHSFV